MVEIYFHIFKQEFVESFLFHMINCCFISFFGHVHVEFEEDVIILLKLISLINQLLFKLDQLRYTFHIKLLQIIVFSKPLKMSPNPLSIIFIQIIFIYFKVYSIDFFPMLFQFWIKLWLQFLKMIHFCVGFVVVEVYFVIY